MKIRSGFVSNSSSSSFLCDVCGILKTGYDGQYGFETSTCWNGHKWCSEHNSDFTTKDKQRIILADENFINDLGKEKIKFIKSGSAEFIEDMYIQYEESIDYEVPEAMCPICNLTSINNNVILEYVLKQTGQKLKNIKEEIRSKFGSLKRLKEGLK